MGGGENHGVAVSCQRQQAALLAATSVRLALAPTAWADPQAALLNGHNARWAPITGWTSSAPWACFAGSPPAPVTATEDALGGLAAGSNGT